MTTKPSRPRLWIVGGPNGSGKSTFYDSTLIEDFGRAVWIINPDILTQFILEQEQLKLEEANLQAVERIMAWLRASLLTHHTVGVETVLSTDKYRALVEEAKGYGFEVRLVFVMLATPDLNIERVRRRVRKGGHNVPEEKIVSRFHRSLGQLPWFLEAADRAYVFDNSGKKPRLVLEKSANGEIVIDPEAPAALRDVILPMQDDETN
jgi:predicted ABC-type ATPase